MGREERRKAKKKFLRNNLLEYCNKHLPGISVSKMKNLTWKPQNETENINR